MSWYVLLGIAIGLSMDAFAVSIASSISLKKVSPRQVFRFAFHFGFFQAMMPIIGWFAGSTFEKFISSWDHWVAFFLLLFVGIKNIIESLKSDGTDLTRCDPTRGWSLVILAVATSIDALAVGLSFAVLEVSIWVPVLVIGLITGFLSMIGMIFGNRIGAKFGERVGIFGGIILIAIGIKILIQHSLS
jgi:putative Mn2+ efflux pump MntP